MVQNSKGMQRKAWYPVPSHLFPSEVTSAKFLCVFSETACGSTHKIRYSPPSLKNANFSICTVLHFVFALFPKIYFEDYSLSACKKLL